MRRILILAGAVLLAAPAAPARADTPTVAVEVGEGVPFTADDLEAAVALRSAEPPPRIEVSSAATAGAVVVTVGASSRSVDLGTSSGPAAARRVAVISLDLFRQAAVPGEVVAAAPAGVEASATSAPSTPAAVIPVAVRPYKPWLVFTGAMSYGNSGIASRSIGHGTIGRRNNLLWVFGGTYERDKGFPDDLVSFVGISVAAGLGWHWRVGPVFVDSSAKLVVSRHRIEFDDGEERLEDSAIRPGGALGLKVFVPLSKRFSLVVGGEATGYATANRYVVGGDEVYTTDRVVTVAIVGLAFTLLRGRQWPPQR